MNDFFDNVGVGLSSIFHGLYPDGMLHKMQEARKSGGDVSETEICVQIKAKVDSATEAMKSDAGYSSTDVAIYVLRNPLNPLKITTDDDLTAQGVRYRIGGPIRLDTAGSHFILRGMIG